MKHKARQLQRDLFIVDTGDTHDGIKINLLQKRCLWWSLCIKKNPPPGNGLSDITSPVGKLTQPLLKKIPYDILTIGIYIYTMYFFFQFNLLSLITGNHELYGIKQFFSQREKKLIISLLVNDVTMDVIKNFVPHWKNRYLTSNVYFKDLNNNKTVPIG